jgi:hypothetical protein
MTLGFFLFWGVKNRRKEDRQTNEGGGGGGGGKNGGFGIQVDDQEELQHSRSGSRRRPGRNSALQEYQSGTAIIISSVAANKSCEAVAFCHTSISPYVANKQAAAATTTTSSRQAQ